MIQPFQCRMARAALGWTLRDLAKATNLALNTVFMFEHNYDRTRRKTIDDIVRVFKENGVEFIPPDPNNFDDAGGVRVRAKK